jgi:hypothetical protein
MTIVENIESTSCVCGHPRDEHDPIAARYCDATSAGSLDRVCICAVMPVAPTRSYDRR